VNGKVAFRRGPEMSIRLSKAFGSSAEVSLGLDYDLAQAEKADQIKVQRVRHRQVALWLRGKTNYRNHWVSLAD